MHIRNLAVTLLLALRLPLHAQINVISGAAALGQPIPDRNVSLPVPVPGSAEPAGFQYPAEDSDLSAAVDPYAAAENKGVLGPIWKTPPEIVSKLTGPDSPNASGLDYQVKGTDLGSMFEHKGRIYFAFGDTNILEATPANHLSNVLAYTTDKDASDGINFQYFTFRDLFEDVPDFYAKESDLQAGEEGKEFYDIDKDIVKNYEAHRQWASGQGPEAAKKELLRKTERIFDYYLNVKRDRSASADYYARLAVRLANFGTSFSDDIAKPSYRNSPSYRAHYDWAMGAGLSDMAREIRLRYDRLFAGVEQAWVKQIFASKTFPDEYTVIPTNGISVGGRIYIHFMSIRSWFPWTVNYAGIAYSDDDGKTFTRVDGLFPPDSNFAQVSFVRDGGYVYLFGIPAGRSGGVKLARVESDKILDKNAYSYCKMADGAPLWVGSEAEADIIVPGPVGELSVQWNPYLNSWLMLYLNDKDEPGDKRRWIEARTSPSLGKPWSAERFVIAPAELSSMGGWGIYGPYMHPVYTEGDGKTVYFMLSMWSHYNVFLLQMRLDDPAGADPALLR